MQIYISRAGQQFGPYSLEDISKYLRDGALKSDDLAWYEGCADWMPLSNVPGISLPASAPAKRRPCATAQVPPAPTIWGTRIRVSLGATTMILATAGWILRYYIGFRFALNHDLSQLEYLLGLVGLIMILVGGAFGFLAILRRDGRIFGLLTIILMALYFIERVSIRFSGD